jgi:GTP cyclohydrolase I
MEEYYRKILKNIGEDPARAGLKKTPLRAAQAFSYITGGYKQDLDKVINGAIFDSDCSDMVICKDIELYSVCEHHLLPFFGKAHIAYVPNGKIIGLSKLARILDYFARRLQIQERLTKQVAETIQKYVDPLGVAVVIEAKHLCKMMRGPEKQNSVMITSAMLGSFRKNAATRAEFLSLIKS